MKLSLRQLFLLVALVAVVCGAYLRANLGENEVDHDVRFLPQPIGIIGPQHRRTFRVMPERIDGATFERILSDHDSSDND